MDQLNDEVNHVRSGSISCNKSVGIFLVSVLGLFLEMLIIRWLTTEVGILAYVQNTVLVVCFLGIGLGCFTSKEQIEIRNTLVPLFVFTMLMGVPLFRGWLHSISQFLSILKDIPMFSNLASQHFGESFALLLIGLTGCYLVLTFTLDMFVPLGRILGRLMDDHPNTLWAYSVNVFGSLIGTWLFVFLSSRYTPPWVWCLAVVALLSFFLHVSSSKRIVPVFLCGGIILFSWMAGFERDAESVVWSPYQKLVVQKSDKTKGDLSKYTLYVNNTRSQELVDLRAKNPNLQGKEAELSVEGYGYCDLPLLLHPNPRKMLILGSGTGNDVAGGVLNGVKKITAVELDPGIVEMGRQFHPQKPYDSPTVNIVIDDARSFFATCQERFDVITFALLDSHTTSFRGANRLDEYVFTRESIEKAKSLLEDGGIMTFHSSAPGLEFGDRIARLLKETFQQEPFTFVTAATRTQAGQGGYMFISGNLQGVREQMQKNPRLKEIIEKWQEIFPYKFPYSASITSDDWPFFYLQTPRIPMLYYLIGGIIILLFVRSCKHWSISREVFHWDRSGWHFFFLGAAFMLLEVQNISKAAVVLGSTWTVNAVIVSGVMCMVLVANYIAFVFPTIKRSPIYAILLGTCFLLYYIDLARFAFLPYMTKAMIVGALVALPMAFSGIIFIRSFSSARRKDHALGTNLFGSLFGGLIQCITFLIGVKALLLVVAALYGLSWLAMPPASGERESVADPSVS